MPCTYALTTRVCSPPHTPRTRGHSGELIATRAWLTSSSNYKSLILCTTAQDSQANSLRPIARREVLRQGDRKSTRLNSSHWPISYAVFCLKKKKNNTIV